MPNASGTLTIRLRPIRIAFVVPDGDLASVEAAININNSLWGGRYNPIIPFYKRLPTWLPAWSRPANARIFFRNTLSLFDPDFVVRVGDVAKTSLDLGHYKEASIGELYKEDLNHKPFGISTREVALHVLQEEFRFARRDALRIVLPKTEDVFVRSVLGGFNPSPHAELLAHPDCSEQSCTRDDFYKLVHQDILTPSRIAHRHIKVRQTSWRRTDCVLVLNPNKVADLTLHWNLRALGWNICPIPLSAAGNPGIQQHAADFITANHYPLRGNPSVYNTTTILGGVQVPEEQLKQFARSLNLPRAGNAFGSALVMGWVPRFWNEWARKNDGVDVVHVWADEQRRDVSIENGSFRFDPVLPTFLKREVYGAYRYANELELTTYDDRLEYAQVIPAGGESLSRVVGPYHHREIRCSNVGIVFFPKHLGWSETVAAPSAEAIFTAWFEERGVQVKLSDKGYITKHLLRQIGGVWRTNQLTNEAIFKFLTKLPSLGAISEKQLNDGLSRLTQSGRTLDKSGLLKWLIESNILKLGFNVECPQCRQKSWFSIGEADYTVSCRQCLEPFRLPCHETKKMPLAYRGSGAFGARVEIVARTGQANPSRDSSEGNPAAEASVPAHRVGDGIQGGLSVLLLLRLLMNSDYHPNITPLLSFKAFSDQKELEVDLAAFIRHTRSGLYQDDVIFAECKSFGGRFTARDVDRLEGFCSRFPGSIPVFATLRRELTVDERRLLKKFAKRGRQRISETKLRNPVVIFTGNELFDWQGPRETWRHGGARFAKFGEESSSDRVLVGLADATQQLYLGMPSIHDENPPRRRTKTRGGHDQADP